MPCDQDPAGDGGLGRVALTTAALLDVEVELMPRFARAPSLLGGLVAAHRSTVEPALESFPVRAFCP